MQNLARKQYLLQIKRNNSASSFHLVQKWWSESERKGRPFRIDTPLAYTSVSVVSHSVDWISYLEGPKTLSLLKPEKLSHTPGVMGNDKAVNAYYVHHCPL